MSTIFSRFYNQISVASSPSSPYDVSRKPLSTLLNDMTRYVALSSQSENEDESIALGLQVLLLNDVERVRAASIRALRYSIHRPTILKIFLKHRLDYLICRSLAIENQNVRERLEAYKFIRRLVNLYPLEIPHSFIYALDSIVSASYLTSKSQQIRSDQMVKPCLELLCEIALINPHILNQCHAINTMLKFIISFQHDELLESVIYALLYAIDRFTINDNSEPTILDSVDSNGSSWIFVDEGMSQRHKLIQYMFSQSVAIFPSCEKDDFQIVDHNTKKPNQYDNSTRNETNKFETLRSCASALKIIFKSWIGFTAFCQSNNSSIRLLVNCLTVQSEPIKMAIIDLFYELLNLDIPIVCDSYEAALKSTYPVWNLTSIEEGYTYIAGEGAAKLPRISSTRPNLLDSHMALMLLTFIDVGFLEAISELASIENTNLSIHATLLLANFIWLCNQHLPEDQSFLLLPLLMDIAIADDSIKRSFAQEAMLNINVFFEFKQRTSHTHSFQLAQLIYHSQHLNDYFTLAPSLNADVNKKKSLSFGDPLAAEKIDILIRDTNTLQTDNYIEWNWDLILFVLKNFPKFANQIQGDLYERFLDKLFDFFKPDHKNGFCDIKLTDPLSNVTCRSLLAFSDLLMYPTRPTSNHIRYIASNTVRTFLSSISNALKKTIVAQKEGIGQPIISDHDIVSKNSVYYYLFLGRLSKTSVGTEALDENEIFVHLLEMLKMDDDFPTSTVVALSSFNYYYDGPCRNYLTQALKSSCTALRLYSTSLLRVLLRCNSAAFGNWGIHLLYSQLYDTNQAVILEAVSVLDEALEDKRLVQMFYKYWAPLGPLSERHPYLTDICHLASSRFCSIPFNQVQYDETHLSKLREELHYWDNVFNARYVIYMETRLFAAYSGGALLTDDYFERRKSSSSSGAKQKRPALNVHVASHIYRQLCLHNEGFSLLLNESRLEQYASELRQRSTNCVSLHETQSIKEALWVLANTASTENGYTWFMEKDLLAEFLRFAEECQNLSVRGTAFYGLSLIAQTPDGAMSLKDFGWETYRVRAHSIPTSIANTDTYQCAERRMSKVGGSISSRRTISQQVSQTSNDGSDKTETSKINQNETLINSDVKSKRSLTMPSTIPLNSNEKKDIRHSVIFEECLTPTEKHPIATIAFPDGFEPGEGPVVVTVPIRRCSSISKDLASVSLTRESILSSTGPSSYNETEAMRSASYGAYSYTSQISTTVAQSTTDSLPLERLRPRSKSAHRSSTLRQSKQLQKVPEVIQALRAPTGSQSQSSEPTTNDELYRSRLLRCNFLLKPDAAGYDYARHIQAISHSTYSFNNNIDIYSDDISTADKKDSFNAFTSKFYKNFYEQHNISDHQIEKFLDEEGKFSLEQSNFDDADEDENTIYRGLAVPVDIRQVVEISDGYNLNYETWCHLVRARSRTNTNADQTRLRTGTNGSNYSGEFAPTASSSSSLTQDQAMFSIINISPTTPHSDSGLNICMSCTNNAAHEESLSSLQIKIPSIKLLASRLIVGIHSEEIEKKLLSWKESHSEVFNNICLYSEICYILTLSSVRIAAQRFLHDLFSDCQFQTFCKSRCQVEILSEDDSEIDDESYSSESA